MNTLYGIDSNKRIRQWTVTAIQNDDGTATIRQEYGLVGGKIAVKDQIVKKGKNLGKANATTPFSQAESQAASKYEAKLHENYVPYIPDPTTFKPPYMLPMLASSMGDGKIIFPCAIQPKYNGICNLAKNSNGISHNSRGGQIFEFIEHLDEFLIKLVDVNQVVHGELYLHDWSLQKIGSCVKKRQTYNPMLQYWIYDCSWWTDCPQNTNITFQQRFMIDLTNKYNQLGGHPLIKISPTLIVNNREEAKALHDKWVSEGYEGAVLKNLDGLYEFQNRSKDIEKLKEYQEAEFEIIGGKEDVEGCVVFTCITEDGGEFDVRPKGSVERRKQYLNELDSLIGKQLTVKFFEWSDDKIPLQPVGVIIRDYE